MNEILICKVGESHTEVEVAFENDTVWLSQKDLSILLDKNIMTINDPIKNIFSEGELSKNSTIRKSLVAKMEGNRIVEFN